MPIRLNGDADIINCGTEHDLRSADQFTFACWTIPRSSGSSSFHSILTNHANHSFFARFGSSQGVNADKLTVYARHVGGWYNAVSSTVLSNNRIYHVAGVYTGSELQCYIDGQPDGSAASATNALSITGGGSELTIGKYGSDYYDGEISDLTLWDTALTDDEINRLFQSRLKGTPLLIQPDNIKSYWPLDEGENGTTLSTITDFYKDRIGNKHGFGVDADGDSTNVAEFILSNRASPIYILPSPSVGVSIQQEGFRWRDDDGTETTATWLASQDVNISRNKNVNTRLRMLINATGDPTTKQYQLEYRKVGDTDWKAVPLE